MHLNRTAYEHAQSLVREKRFVLDDRDDRSGHQPSAQGENRFVEEHGIDEFGKWHLGIHEDKSEGSKGRYAYPTGTSRTSTAAGDQRRVTGRPWLLVVQQRVAD